MNSPTWSPVPPPPFDVDAEADRITSEVWASVPRPERIDVAFNGRRSRVGVPRTDDVDLLRVCVREALRGLVEG